MGMMFLPTGSAARNNNLRYRFMRELLCPPVLVIRDTGKSMMGKKGAKRSAELPSKVVFWVEVQHLTHGAA